MSSDSFFGTIRRMTGPVEVGAKGTRGMSIEIGVGPDGGEETHMENIVTIDTYVPLDFTGSKVRVERDSENARARASLDMGSEVLVPLSVRSKVEGPYIVQVIGDNVPHWAETFFAYRLK